MSIREPELDSVTGPGGPVGKWEEGEDLDPVLDPTELDDPEELDDEDLLEDDEFPEEEGVEEY